MNLLKNRTGLAVIALIIAGGFVYSFNINNGLFWDDDDWIVNNSFVHSVNWNNVKFWFTHDVLAGIGLKSNYYRPFLFFTFALNYIISGVKPLLYHLTSNAIHIFNSVLVFWLVRQVFSPRFDLESSKRSNLVAFLTALFFLIHPLQTEAITYISGRGDALAAMFMLLALLFFQKSQLTLPDDVTSSGNVRFVSLAFLVLGLLSRETAIIFPMLALAFYVSVLSNEGFAKAIKTGIKKTWPYFAVVIVYGILRLTVLNFQNTLNFYSQQNVYSENLHVRMFTFLPILWEYLKLLVVPVGLHMERSANVYASLFQWPVWPIALLSAFGIWHLTRRFYKNLGTSDVETTSDVRVWLLGVLWFFIALAPVSGITPINALIYEHWLYLPMVGFWIIVSFYLVKLFDFQGSTPQGSTLNPQKGRTFVFGRTLLIVAFIAYFSFFAYQSIQRNIVWGKPVEFYKNILEYEPDNARINNNLGNQYFNQGDKEQAEVYYRKAIEAGDIFAQPHFNIGSILQSRGDIKGAIAEFNKAIEIDPNFYYPYQDLAVIYAQQGDLVQAAANMEKLKMLLPGNPRVYYNSALVYLALNNKEKAVADLKEGLKYSGIDLETGRLIEELIQKLQK
ncbi:MAG: tetratricopeptide repeat protein [Candidatus Yanofskybacteria bacterium]|nr:tetratricopeptide repeat protein [Candidatus Yanofskybacteria bacterium]